MCKTFSSIRSEEFYSKFFPKGLRTVLEKCRWRSSVFKRTHGECYILECYILAAFQFLCSLPAILVFDREAVFNSFSEPTAQIPIYIRAQGKFLSNRVQALYFFAGIYLFKVNTGNTRTICKIFSTLRGSCITTGSKFT